MIALDQAFWLASRAFGIVALVLLSLSVSLGLAMSGRLLRRPGLPAKLKRHHEAATLVTLGLIVAHGGVLLLDGYLRPSLAGVTLPFALGYRPFWTGLGVIGGWLALILAGSFYVRRWIGVKTWRRLHRWTLAVYAARARPRRGRRHRRSLHVDARAADRARRAQRARALLPNLLGGSPPRSSPRRAALETEHSPQRERPWLKRLDERNAACAPLIDALSRD